LLNPQLRKLTSISASTFFCWPRPWWFEVWGRGRQLWSEWLIVVCCILQQLTINSSELTVQCIGSCN